MSALSRLDDMPRWVVWRNEARQDDPTKFTKVPYQPNGRKASSTASATWVRRGRAEDAVPAIVNGTGGGIGIVLGDIGDDTVLAGIDLDTCRREDGTFEPWAQGILERFRTYTEVSPSGKGAKLFFWVRIADFEAIKPLLRGNKTGGQFKKPSGGDHPPGFEIYFLGRYFAVTEQHLAGTPSELATIGEGELRWLLTEAGLALVGNGNGQKGAGRGKGPRDDSRSAPPFRLGLRMQQAGKSFEEFCEAIRNNTDPETADWYREKGVLDDERELDRIWKNAKVYIEDDAAPSGTIRLCGGNRPEAVEAAIAALDEASVPLYRRGLNIVHVARIPAKASDGKSITTPAIGTVPTQQLLHELGKVAVWQKFDGRREQWVTVDVPPDIAARIAALPNEWRFPPLAGIIGTQTLRLDGSLLTEPGYDAETGFILFKPPRMPPIPETPTREQANAALGMLDGLLDEFPFVFEAQYSHADNPSRSVALSALMTPVLRPALAPAVPLHACNAPAGGTGKSYLFDLASGIAIGERCPVLSRSTNPDETEKRLVGAALDGQPIVSIDNSNGELRSEFLCQAVERPLLQVRALGSSALARIPNAATCFANGNNIQIAEDLVRRTIQCRMDANMESPETRQFKRDPLARVLAHRGHYVAAILTVARAHIAAGLLDKPAPYMSFHRWSDVVRGSLIWLGRADPIETVAELSVADPIKEVRGEVFCAITTAMPDRAGNGHLVAEIVSKAREEAALGDALMLVAEKDGKLSPRGLGKWLAGAENKIARGYKLLRNGKDKSRVRWQLARV